jgi:propanediol dehydratase small subunit
LLDSALHLALDDSSFSRVDEVGRLTVLIADRRRDYAAAVSRAETLFNAFAESASDMGMKMALEAEKTAKAVQAEIDELQAQKDRASGRASAAEHLSRLNDLREQLYDDDLDVRRVARLKVAAGLNSVIQIIECNPDRTAAVYYKERARFTVLSPGRGRRPSTFTDFDLQAGKEYRGNDPKVVALIKRMASAAAD